MKFEIPIESYIYLLRDFRPLIGMSLQKVRGFEGIIHKRKVEVNLYVTKHPQGMLFRAK